MDERDLDALTDAARKRAGAAPFTHDQILLRECADAIAALRARAEQDRAIVAAAENLVVVKGRHNSEIAYKRLADAIDRARSQGEGTTE